MSTSRTLDAILFDVDGTLAETERDGHRVAFNAAFAEFGLDWRWDSECYGGLLAVTGGKERIRQYISTARPTIPAGMDVAMLVRRLHQRKTEHYVRLIGGGEIELRPGVLRLLREARKAKVRLAIATTTTMDNVIALLQSVGDEPGLIDWFDEIAAGDVVAKKKPAPDIYRLVLSKLKLDAERCVAIEDTGHGLRSALGAGIRSVVITPSIYSVDEDFSGAALIADCLGDARHPAHGLGGAALSQPQVTLETLESLVAQQRVEV